MSMACTMMGTWHSVMSAFSCMHTHLGKCKVCFRLGAWLQLVMAQSAKVFSNCLFEWYSVDQHRVSVQICATMPH